MRARRPFEPKIGDLLPVGCELQYTVPVSFFQFMYSVIGYVYIIHTFNCTFYNLARSAVHHLLTCRAGRRRRRRDQHSFLLRSG